MGDVPGDLFQADIYKFKYMYNFTDEKVKELYDRLKVIVPIRFENNENIDSNAKMDCKEDHALIKYKSCADEHIDILHELIHVQMFYEEGYCQLAWSTGDPRITSDLEDAVTFIRDIVDDTYVYHKLYTKYGIFPISPIFFSGIFLPN